MWVSAWGLTDLLMLLILLLIFTERIPVITSKTIPDWVHDICRSDDDEPARTGIKQRLFCDICDVFDQHDTDDCPTQSSGALDNQGTQYHGNRNEDRPYCDICEGMMYDETVTWLLSLFDRLSLLDSC